MTSYMRKTILLLLITSKFSFSRTPPVLHHHYPHQPHLNGTVGRVPHNHNAASSSNTNSYPQPHPWVRNSVGNTAAAFGLYPTTNPSSRHQQKVCPSSGRCGRKGFVVSIGIIPWLITPSDEYEIAFLPTCPGIHILKAIFISPI